METVVFGQKFDPVAYPLTFLSQVSANLPLSRASLGRDREFSCLPQLNQLHLSVPKLTSSK